VWSGWQRLQALPSLQRGESCVCVWGGGADAGHVQQFARAPFTLRVSSYIPSLLFPCPSTPLSPSQWMDEALTELSVSVSQVHAEDGSGIGAAMIAVVATSS
jgi:hypothetical protein